MKNLSFMMLVIGVMAISVLCLSMSLNEAKAIMPETQFQLKVNQTFTMESYGIKITFLNITSDSRCPYDVTCVWQGEAQSLIKINENNQNRGNFTLSTLSGHDQIIFGTHTLHLIQVKPFVSSAKKISITDYVIILKMSEAYVQSPLKQFKSGISANDIICRPDMQLLIQNQENFPICVKLGSVSNLLHRDWSYPTNCKYVNEPFTAGVTGIIVIEKNEINSSSGKSYSPRNNTVVIGWNNTVSWINQDVTPSSVTSDWNLFDSGPILPGADWRHDFECAGNYGYHSEPHPWMKGWIRVLPPSR